FEKTIFRRPEEYSNFSSGSIHAVVFEVDDRETIGGSAYGGQRAVCCTADLAKLGVCTQGEIIHRPSTDNPHWPQEVVVEGKTVRKNPTGYLPVCKILERSSCFTKMCYSRYNIGMFEMAFWYFDYFEFSETGVRPTGITVWVVTFGTIKRTVSRMIILMVSMRYGDQLLVALCQRSFC
ncbi:hypothetical protein A4A49_57646, partial [Nicotiana attenuata]